MPYVQRDENGKVIGLYAQLQAGYAEELLEDENEEVTAFLSPPADASPAIRQFSEPMLAAGFAAMGFTKAQIDAFFEAVSSL